MRYASIIRAELGWEVILVDCDGNSHVHVVKRWGVPVEGGRLIPLDKQGESMYRSNFVMLINPNEKIPSEEIALMVRQVHALVYLKKSST